MILIHQRYRQTDRQTDGRHAISIPRYALVHRAVKIDHLSKYVRVVCLLLLTAVALATAGEYVTSIPHYWMTKSQCLCYIRIFTRAFLTGSFCFVIYGFILFRFVFTCRFVV